VAQVIRHQPLVRRSLAATLPHKVMRDSSGRAPRASCKVVTCPGCSTRSLTQRSGPCSAGDGSPPGPRSGNAAGDGGDRDSGSAAALLFEMSVPRARRSGIRFAETLAHQIQFWTGAVIIGAAISLLSPFRSFLPPRAARRRAQPARPTQLPTASTRSTPAGGTAAPGRERRQRRPTRRRLP
jgi:hypothetical protein